MLENKTKTCPKCGHVYEPKFGKDGKPNWVKPCPRCLARRKGKYRANRKAKIESGEISGDKVCKECGEKKPIEAFVVFSNTCKKCSRKNLYDAEKHAMAKMEALEAEVSGKKWCSHCEQYKEYCEFGRHKVRGLEPYCKVCRGEKAKNGKVKPTLKQKTACVKKYLSNDENAPRKVLERAIKKELIENPHLSSNVIAKKLKTSFESVERFRIIMEENNEIPLYMEVKTVKGGWRRRKYNVKRDPYTGEDFIYFIEDELGPIKIGFSNKGVYGRLESMFTSNPRELKILAVMPGSRLTEKRLHQLFQTSRIRNEWFHRHPKILAMIDNINKKYPLKPVICLAEARKAALEKFERTGKKSEDKNPYRFEGKKKCGQCEQILPYSEFYARSITVDGFDYRCKTCVNPTAKKRIVTKKQFMLLKQKESDG
jgi:hypothetical protein